MSDESSSETHTRGDRAQTTVPMVPPALITRPFAMLLGGLCFGVWLLKGEAEAWLGDALPPIASLAPLAVALLAIALRKLWLPSRAPSIIFGDTSLTLPRSRTSRRSDTLNYEELRTALPLVVRREPALVIDTPARTYVYTASDFPHPETWRLVWADMLERVRARPEGESHLLRMRQLAALSEEVTGKRPWFTPRLLVVLAIAFAAQSFLTPPVEVLKHLYAGANSALLVFEQGQIFRVFTANLLHGGLLHLGFNAMGLLFLGTYLERLFGLAPTILLTLATALAGAIASLLGSDALFSVGISTALFGLLGAYLALHLRFGAQIPPPYRQTRRWWITVLALNTTVSLLLPVIDAWGHFGGLLAGLALGLLLLGRQRHFEPPRASATWINLSAAGLVAAYTLAAFFAIHYATGEHPEDEALLAHAMADDADKAGLAIESAAQWADYPERRPDAHTYLSTMLTRARAHTDDPYLIWRATTTLRQLAEDLPSPEERRARELEALGAFERFVRSQPSDDPELRATLAYESFTFEQRYDTFVNPDEIPTQRVDWNPETRQINWQATSRLDVPARYYVLAGAQGQARLLLEGCAPAGDRHRRPAPDAMQADDVLLLLVSVEDPSCQLEDWQIYRLNPDAD
ncbi:rhomboid family intramembrane serine protease [Bradymonadaceae bacterium TMQ3]|nr:rhomboid family intramembrane serine protease [Bradymonadaceae bacterium TMQ3]TXC77241.1 rhomboid family intramembrane serine protease [Bradymonadales bacterium TMQ1]